MYVYMYVCICMCKSTYMHICVCISVCIYVYIYVYRYIHMFVYIHIHTHIHKHVHVPYEMVIVPILYTHDLRTGMVKRPLSFCRVGKLSPRSTRVSNQANANRDHTCVYTYVVYVQMYAVCAL